MMKSVAVLCGITATLCAGLVARGELYQFVVPLDGAQEVPGPGDPDGSGMAVLLIDSTALTIDWQITVNDIELPLTGAHIHNAPAGSSGPVRVDFSAQLNGSGLFDADLAGVLADPSAWYVNVHNASYRAGAIRGQLGESVIVPEASSVYAGLGVLGMCWFAWHRRRQVAG